MLLTLEVSLQGATLVLASRDMGVLLKTRDFGQPVVPVVLGLVADQKGFVSYTTGNVRPRFETTFAFIRTLSWNRNLTTFAKTAKTVCSFAGRSNIQARS